MIIFAIESSCDETAVAIVRNGREVLSNEIFSQAQMHSLYGGVVPEIASRNHVAAIGSLSELALRNSGLRKSDIDAVAVTYAPGLIGALLVGLNFAKGLALALGVPLIPVHHLRGHIAANYLAYPNLEPPFLSLIISGGNTLIANVSSYSDIKIIGRSRDDAAGECFDKTARVLGLGYPGGPILDKISVGGNDSKYSLPRPMIDDAPYDMSFSGLKTAVVNLVHNTNQKSISDRRNTSDKRESETITATGKERCRKEGSVNPCGDELQNPATSLDVPSLAASFAKTVSDILVPRVMGAALEFKRDKISLAGGVAANSRIRADFTIAANNAGKTLLIPPLNLCGDNAAMIGSQAYYEYINHAGISIENTETANLFYPPDMHLDAKATMEI